MFCNQSSRTSHFYDHKSRKPCEFFGFSENFADESIIIFHECSNNFYENTTEKNWCGEKHIGNTPRTIMTKGTSTQPKPRPYGNFHPGNNDKLMISYRREPSHDYSMAENCGVLYRGEMHFFGGKYYNGARFADQHFVVERQRSGQLVKMTKKKNLDNELQGHSCSTFDITSETFPWTTKTIVILCFDQGSKS